MARHRAFISYSHADARFASRLQRDIENFRVPAATVKRLELDTDRLNPVFRDTSDLPAAGRLTDAFTQALSESEALIVVCSGAAVHSDWVNQEIQAYLDVHGLDLSDVLMGGENSPRSELAYYRNGLLKAYRKNQYKIHFYASESSNERLTKPELYDLHQDVGEMRNVAAQHPEVVAALLQAAEVHREATPMAEPVFDKRYVKFKAAANEQ